MATNLVLETFYQLKKVPLKVIPIYPAYDFELHSRKM
jgi:hypothetical protein